ncbi:MAG: 3-hydroxyacyl-[acyl-carrier-protein] dehydratase FabZ, partial [Candidatus Scalindua sp.]|nr:3-hydroxyacyl-[acyl-carrier-protein] dehydratase FabZ [Candidatus Scalindua sp.]
MLNFEEVRELVPQKYPFLFIDKVIELQKESRIVCLKNISGNEPFFAGHFPDFAIMPGVLIVEALAQASIILFKKSF